MNQTIIKFGLSILCFLLFPMWLSGEVRYHCPNDSDAVVELLSKISADAPIGERVSQAAAALTGIPASESADNDTIGTIVIRLDSLSRRELINVALAAAIAAAKTDPQVKDFEKALENVSRKKGKDEGFASQFFYGSDWIVDNKYRGNIEEMTEYVENGNYKTKTLDYVTRNKDKFPAMKNPQIADKVQVSEMGFRSHRVPHLKKQSVTNKNIKGMFQDGDIIIMLPPDYDFDIYDIGILTIINGEPFMTHVDKETGLIGQDKFPLSRLFKNEGQFFYGFRWIRPLE